MVYGGFWRRFLAWVLDSILIGILSTLVSILIGNSSAAAGSVGLHFLYSSLLISSKWQATLGMRGLGMKVVDYEGQPVDFPKAAIRYAASLLSVITLGFGFLMIAFTDRKQALHDKIAGTLVVLDR